MKSKIKDQDENKTLKCCHVDRVSIHPSIKIGGSIVGECKNKVAPGMNCCWEHATKEALIYYVQTLLKENSKLKRKKDDL